MEKLTLTKDSKLIETYWHYDDEAKEGAYKEREVEFLSPHYFHELYCFIEEDATLKDIFIFMNKNLLLLNVYLGNWCEDLVQEGLTEIPPTPSEKEYLECFWIINKDSNNTVHFPNKVDFHGKGMEHNFSLSFCSAKELAHLPVIINPELKLYNDNDEGSTLGNLQPTLFQILYGIVWELSFFGSPTQRDEEKQNLEETIKDIKNRGDLCLNS